ncbi:hypothetical protein C2845_PM15G04590 [Panicum miliaceum]|uniref:TF-B3 domain-containing protein n=1 Tax=Panicum miliaceum TaxID=4540 RepID=A0A3L6Q5X4_PANMI|nr:hypothetical protein C2845_PM15G04590 [Panicum miliaceum]
MFKQLKVLMPPSFHKLPISDELADCFDASSSGGTAVLPGPTALVVSPFGKVRRVEVGRDGDGDGAFLGRGWAEFLAAHGIGVGWFVVLRHEGRGVLTVKTFDTGFCIKEFAAPAADIGYDAVWSREILEYAMLEVLEGLVETIGTDNTFQVMTSGSSKGVYCKPQFLRIIQQDSMEEMPLQKIPARFVKHYITEECLNRRMAVVVSPLGKFWRIKLQNDQSGVFFAGAWSQFMAFHGISEGEVLLLRYEGNMVFSFKVFGISGCQKDLKNHNTPAFNKESPSYIKKRKADNERARFDEEKRSKSSVTSLNNVSSLSGLDYQIGPPAWIAPGHGKCAVSHTKKVCYLLGEGWKCFCKENRLKKGDLCTFHVIETMLWHVVITHYTDKKKESPCSSSMERKSINHRLSSEEQLRPQEGSMIYLSKASSYTRSAYEIDPPTWIKKKIKAYSLEKHLFLAQGFCDGIGLQEPCCTITLKTSINSTRSWLIRGTKQRNGCYLLGSGWKKFSQENELKVGDICTFNIVEMSLWHVVITRA